MWVEKLEQLYLEERTLKIVTIYIHYLSSDYKDSFCILVN